LHGRGNKEVVMVHKLSVKDRMRHLFETNMGKPVPVWEFYKRFHTLKHTQRISELRAEGYDIRHIPGRLEDGTVTSTYIFNG
jgi:hypothetical protein